MISPQAIPEQRLYSDFSKLTELKKGAREQSPEAIRQVAKQFESLFVQMMLKSMRDTLPENELFGSQSERMYRDMYDKQLSLNMSNGQGIGLRDVIERQLGGTPDVEESLSEKPLSDYLANPFPVARTKAPETVEQKRISEPSVTLAALSDSRFQQAVAHPPLVQTPKGPWQSAEAFIKDVYPHAIEAGQRLGIDPDVLVAQSALETGWGKHLPLKADGSNSFNLFGIKADQRWQGDTVNITTREYRHGVMQKESAMFRSYDSVSDAFNDYVDFISQSPRYQKALQHGYDGAAYVRELQRAGYATDPEYARKINRVRNSEQLQGSAQLLKNSIQVPLT